MSLQHGTHLNNSPYGIYNPGFISLYCFLSVQYLNYISIFQLIAPNIFYKQHIKTYVLSKTPGSCLAPTHTLQQACCCIYSLVTEVKTIIVSP